MTESDFSGWFHIEIVTVNHSPARASAKKIPVEGQRKNKTEK